MSVKTITITNQYTHSAAFCDKSCKTVRVIADSLSKACVALFYKVISAVAYAYSAQAADRYDSLAQLKWDKIHWETFKHYDAEIVDFSSNSVMEVDEMHSRSEWDSLKEIYGTERVERLQRMWPEDFLGDLSRDKIVDNGCCWGMSLDFISSYLQQRRVGKNAFEAVKEIAPHFENGASKDAEISQIFYEAFIDNNELSERIDAEQEKTQRWLEDEKAQIKRLPSEKIHERLELLKRQVGERGRAFKMQQMDLFAHREALPNFNKIASAVSLVARSLQLTENNIDVDGLNDYVAALANGAYEVSVLNADGAHSIAFIKTGEGQDFIFDSNDATLAVDFRQSTARLWDVVNNYSGKDFWLLFTPYQSRLASD